MHVAVASDCYQIEGMDERKEYIATRNAVDVVGITSAEQPSRYV